jgi:hypothetical protein
MPTLLHFADPSNRRPGLGATIRLDSGELCSLSIARIGAIVRRSRFGFFGPVLYQEKNLYQVAATAAALTDRFPDNLLPAGFTDPVLSAFANAIFHCSTCAQVSIILNGALKERSSTDIDTSHKAARAAPLSELTTADVPRILQKYGELIEKYPTAYVDETLLPVSKHQMKMVLKAAWKMAPNEQLRNHVEVGWTLLSMFQPNIGEVPIDCKISPNLLPEDMAQLDRFLQIGKVAQAESEKDREELQEFIRKNQS